MKSEMPTGMPTSRPSGHIEEVVGNRGLALGMGVIAGGQRASVNDFR